jgi:hypothetical protein
MLGGIRNVFLAFRGSEEIDGCPWSEGLPGRRVGLATLSGLGAKSKPNPFKLPIDLTAAGAPHCYWNVGLETQEKSGTPIDCAGDDEVVGRRGDAVALGATQGPLLALGSRKVAEPRMCRNPVRQSCL